MRAAVRGCHSSIELRRNDSGTAPELWISADGANVRGHVRYNRHVWQQAR